MENRCTTSSFASSGARSPWANSTAAWPRRTGWAARRRDGNGDLARRAAAPDAHRGLPGAVTVERDPHRDGHRAAEDAPPLHGGGPAPAGGGDPDPRPAGRVREFLPRRAERRLAIRLDP